MTLAQPYSEALTIPCDIVLEFVEAKLDEGLSYLEDDKPRLARKHVAAVMEFGSVAAFVAEAMKIKRQSPDTMSANGPERENRL